MDLAHQDPLSMDFQARRLEWVAIPFSKGSSQPKNWTQFSCIAGRFFTILAMRKVISDHTRVELAWNESQRQGTIKLESDGDWEDNNSLLAEEKTVRKERLTLAYFFFNGLEGLLDFR